ncbi:hypothetical protein [Nannocystis radixulma]|uniref:hypothetical protein n=1 Tax=Nannocystis radixulma TaxID=2995305 RepID=UPI00232CB395|nr:hypothetical protein [Nannocystis radixulma]
MPPQQGQCSRGAIAHDPGQRRRDGDRARPHSAAAVSLPPRHRRAAAFSPAAERLAIAADDEIVIIAVSNPPAILGRFAAPNDG